MSDTQKMKRLSGHPLAGTTMTGAQMIDRAKECLEDWLKGDEEEAA